MSRNNSKLQWAQHWALQGFSVFPVLPNSKRPVNKDWPNAATRNPAQIAEWWLAWPDANIGAVPGASGHVVIDVDTKKVDGLAALEKLPPLPATFVTETPTGGRHIWLALEGSCKNSASNLAPGIDTRGRRGFVVMPGSTIDGKPYRIAQDEPIANAPSAWAERLKALEAQDDERTAAPDAKTDTPEQLALARQYLEELADQGDVAIEGQGGNQRTFRLFAMLRDMGVSEHAAADLVEKHWNDACRPPWDAGELDTIARNAYAYAQNDASSKVSDASGSGFVDVSAPVGSTAPVLDKKSRFKPLSIKDMETLPDPIWLVPGWLPHYELNLLYGAPESMKSFAALDLALSMASGFMPWGVEGDMPARPTLYVAGEGQIGLAKKRVPAWREHNSAPDDLPFYLVKEAPLARNGHAELTEFFSAIEAEIGDALPRLIVFDTHTRIMSGLDENTTQDTGKAIEFYDALRARYSCAILVIHHCDKQGNMERGSSALRAACETVLRMDRQSDLTTVLRCEKMKDAEKPAAIAFGVTTAGPSIVLAPKEYVKQERAKSELYLAAVSALRDANAHTLATGMTTSALSASLPILDGEQTPDTREAARRKLEIALRRAAKGELAPLTAPGIDPLTWLLPSLG